MIDTLRKKIIDFEIVLQRKKGVQGNYRGSSNGMEVDGIKRMMERWKDDDRIVGCVHDNDAKSTKAINAIRPDMKQYFDPNHVAKCFGRKWHKLAPKHLRGFKGKLLSWFHYLARSDFSDEEKTVSWLNAVEHFKGNHAGCPREHLNPEQTPLLTSREAEDEMRLFLQKTVKYVVRTRTPFDQQMCESFNAVKAQFASKSISWKISWACRIMCAVMQMNVGGHWKLELAEECGIDLSDETRQRLIQRYAKDLAQNKMRRTPERQKKEAQRRRAVKSKARLSQRGAEDYRLPLVAYRDAVQMEAYLDADPDDPGAEPGDPDDEIVEALPAAREIPDKHRSELPVPLLADYAPGPAPLIVPLLLADDDRCSRQKEEEDEDDPAPLRYTVPGLPLMDAEMPPYLEDEASGADFRVVMEEGGRQCTLVYRRVTLEPSMPVALPPTGGDGDDGNCECAEPSQMRLADSRAIDESGSADHHGLSRCQGVLCQLLAYPWARKFLTLFDSEYEIDHEPMCFADVQRKLDERVYQSFGAFAQDVQQVLEDAHSCCDLSDDLHEAASRLRVAFDLMITANHQRSTRCEAILSELLASGEAYKFFTLFASHYDIDHQPMCFADVQRKLHHQIYESFDAFCDGRSVGSGGRTFLL
jgi:hypothetical protein